MPDTGEEPWVTDGTRNGTRALGDLCPGSCGSAIDDVVGGWTADFLALFTAESPVGSRGQWITDGTVAGTRRLTPANVQVVRGASNGWVFAARDAAYGEELWQAGLTPETTTLWYDLERERDSGSYPRALGAAGNLLVFTAFDAAHGRRLWRSDGSFAGTAPIPGSGPAGFEIGESASAGGHVFYTGRAPEAEVSALWATNAGARRAARVTPRGVAVRSHLHAIGPRVFFVADDALHGYELWVSAGTRETTHLVRDMVPGHGSSRLAPVEGSLAGQFVFARDRAPHVGSRTAAKRERALSPRSFPLWPRSSAAAALCASSKRWEGVLRPGRRVGQRAALGKRRHQWRFRAAGRRQLRRSSPPAIGLARFLRHRDSR
jgi:ELWxxDGT repeat protein